MPEIPSAVTTKTSHLQIVHDRSFRTPSTDLSTRHLFVANCGVAAGISTKAIENLFGSLGATELQLPTNKRSILFASFRTAQDADQALQVLSSEETQKTYRKFTVKFAELSEEEVQALTSAIGHLNVLFCILLCQSLRHVRLRPAH